VVLLLGGEALGAPEGRNPFTFPAGVLKGTGKQEGIGPGQGDKESTPAFRVTTILVSGQTKVAAVNGVLVRKGEDVNGYRVVEIDETQVILRRGKERLVLKMEVREKVPLKKMESKK
jgi:hypothetical protein